MSPVTNQPDCAGSLHVCRLRVARLDTDGVPLPGANNLYTTKALIRLAYEPGVVEGEKFQQRNGQGDLCGNFRERDVIDQWNLELELCTPDPGLVEILTQWGSVLTQDGQVTGFATGTLGESPDDAGCSVEAFTRAIAGGVQAAELPWWWYVMPRTYWRLGGSALERGFKNNPLVGYAVENENWFDGPANDWPHLSTSALMYDRTDSIPDEFCGYQTLAAS